MDIAPREMRRRPSSPRNRIAPALVAIALALVGLSAIIDWPRSEPQARHALTLRAAELDAWLRQELLVPIDRVAFAEPGGASDAAAAWRLLFVALDGQAARSLTTLPALPPSAPGTPTGETLQSAIGARRFSPFDSIDALLADEWLRGARVLSTLVRRADLAGEPVTAWLDGAIVLGADLRSTGLLAPTLAAAQLEEGVEIRLQQRGEETADLDSLQRLRRHAETALGQIPPPKFVAERESRVSQALACTFADIAPFQPVRERLTTDEPWPLVPTAAAVERLEGYDEFLAALLAPMPADRERASYDRFAEEFARRLPLAAPLLADRNVLLPVREAPERLQRIVALVAKRLERDHVASDGGR